MLNRFIEQHFGLPVEQVSRLAHLLFLAATLMMSIVLGYTIGSALFLTKAGPEHIPPSYLLVGVFSIPIYTFFSHIIDRYRRPLMVRYLLLASILLVILLRILICINSLPAYYAIYIGFHFQWVMAIDILFPSLVSDYFTVLDWKSYAPLLAIAMAVGELLSGGLARLLATYMESENILLILPLLYGMAIAQLVYLERCEKPLEDLTPERENGLLESLKAFPMLVRRYPLILFLAASPLLFIILYSLAEFESYIIYSQAFPNDQELTSFLGMLWAAFSVVQLFAIYFCTRPAIARIGVSRMNLVYPLTTLASFAALAVNFSLPSAILANLNYSPLYKSIDVPVYNLNYNAVPPRFIGRVRAIGGGLFYSLGLALAGGFLWVAENAIGTFQITLTGIAIAAVFLALRHLMGKSYLQSLLTLLHSGSVNLDEVSEGLVRLPAEYGPKVSQLLGSNDPHSQLLGVELVFRMENASWFLHEVQELIPHANLEIHRAIVRLFSNFHHPHFTRYLKMLLSSENEKVREVALEVSIASSVFLSEGELRSLIESPNAEIQALTCVAAQQASIADSFIQTACSRVLGSHMESNARLCVIRAVRSSGDRQLLPLLAQVLDNAPAAVKLQGLNALALLARPGDVQWAELAAGELGGPVRGAAFHLLGVVLIPSLLPQVASGLSDDSQIVREKAAVALAAYGENGLPLAQSYLDSPQPEVVEAAIAAIASVRTDKAEDILFKYLDRDYCLVKNTLEWQKQIPTTQLTWQPLAIALADYHQRLLNRVLHVLTCLGDKRTLNCIRRILKAPDFRMRANAVETLASISHKRFVQPILPLLEHLATAGASQEGVDKRENLLSTRFALQPERHSLLQQSLKASDRWIRCAAILVMSAKNYPLPAIIIKDSDPLVRLVAEYASLLPQSRARQDEFFMNRLLFLKNISFLQNFSLDELLIINSTLKQDEFLPGETIFAEGSVGSDFYIVYRGSVLILKGAGQLRQQLAKLIPGQYFGEMALFDDFPRSATAVADNDCVLLTLERNRFNSLLSQRPEIMLEMCKVFSQRLRFANDHLAISSNASKLA